MSRITKDLYVEDGERWRWSVQREKDDVHTEFRITIKEPYTGSPRLTIFIDEAAGDEAKSMVMNEEHLEDAISGLQQALSFARGEQKLPGS